MKIPWKQKKLWPKNIESLTVRNNNKKNKNNNKNTDETIEEQKDIPITWGCDNKNTHYEASICPILMNEASLERA